jgi:peptidoglycan hydrolase CwlO-like protein
MSLNSTITLAVVFSFFALLGQAFSIYAIVHSRTKESHDKDSEMVRNFTRLEVKLDTFNQRIDNIEKTVEKSDGKLDDINNHMTRTDERINSLQEVVSDLKSRVSKLEGGR